MKGQLFAAPVSNFTLINMPQKKSIKSVIMKAAGGSSISVVLSVAFCTPWIQQVMS